MATAQGILTALVVVFGMLTVAYVTVAWSNSQQFGAFSAASGSIVTETSSPLVNRTTTGQQGNASSPETTFVSILAGSADSVSISFSPDQVMVAIGVNNTVTWVNNDNAAHTITARDGSFDSGNIGSGGSYTYTFTTPGTYRYYCAYHSWMTGTVVVEAG
ncbi:MAG: cupredoxin domain-containing protein [Thaumarchaeota archaeon]|nr:cupredoxin domain-containing protein [Nitrososphaerota archaeon]